MSTWPTHYHCQHDNCMSRCTVKAVVIKDKEPFLSSTLNSRFLRSLA
jgi:hypothetical protein